jgi:hypothetical protein
MRFSLMSDWFYSIIGFGERALPTPVADLMSRYAA